MNMLGSNGNMSSRRLIFGRGKARLWLGNGLVVTLGLGFGGAIFLVSMRSWIEWRRRKHRSALWPGPWWNLQNWEGSWLLGRTAGGGVGCSKVRCLVAKSWSRASDRFMLRGVKILGFLRLGFWGNWVSMVLTSLELELGYGKGLLPNFLGELTLGLPLSRIPAWIVSWISAAHNCWIVAKG